MFSPMILALETSTKTCSVALANAEGHILAERRLRSEQYIHSEKLHLFMQAVLEEAGLKPAQLSGVAVGRGPGSYTGLRIGVAAAKGFCWPLNLPLYSATSLFLLAQAWLQENPQEGKPTDRLLPMLDARRQEVYLAGYDGQGQEITPVQARIMEPHSLQEWQQPTGRLILLGDGVAKFREWYQQDRVQLEPHHDPQAATLASYISRNRHRLQAEDLAYFEPFYLKDFIAGKPRDLLRR